MTNEKIGTLFRECHYSLHRFVTNQEVFDETIKRIKRIVFMAQIRSGWHKKQKPNL